MDISNFYQLFEHIQDLSSVTKRIICLLYYRFASVVSYLSLTLIKINLTKMSSLHYIRFLYQSGQSPPPHTHTMSGKLYTHVRQSHMILNHLVTIFCLHYFCAMYFTSLICLLIHLFACIPEFFKRFIKHATVNIRVNFC